MMPTLGNRRGHLWAAAAVLTLAAPATVAGQSPTTAPAVAPADVHFMSGMIPHHAQAVKIAGWAPSHGASPELQRLAERIVVGQRDEIALMQRWLSDRGLPVPDADATHLRMTMAGGGAHDMLMPGMDGMSTIAAIRQIAPAMPIVAMSGMVAAHKHDSGTVASNFGRR